MITDKVVGYMHREVEDGVAEGRGLYNQSKNEKN